MHIDRLYRRYLNGDERPSQQRPAGGHPRALGEPASRALVNLRAQLVKCWRYLALDDRGVYGTYPPAVLAGPHGLARPAFQL
jgi:hypothetical protein